MRTGGAIATIAVVRVRLVGAGAERHHRAERVADQAHARHVEARAQASPPRPARRRPRRGRRRAAAARADAAKVEAQRREPGPLQRRRQRHDEVVLHAAAVLRMGMADDDARGRSGRDARRPSRVTSPAAKRTISSMRGGGTRPPVRRKTTGSCAGRGRRGHLPCDRGEAEAL